MPRQESKQNRSKERVGQKNRTRKALLTAADALIRNGKRPTVADVAEAAGISRATAYRYFPTQEMLLAEVALFSVGGPLFQSPAEGVSVEDAAVQLVRRVGVWTYANEVPLRTLLRLSLDPSTGIQRPGHRVEWIADLLAPVRKEMDPESYGKLSRALTLLFGIDPVVVMKDIAGASKEQALSTLEWTARVLIVAALDQKRRR